MRKILIVFLILTIGISSVIGYGSTESAQGTDNAPIIGIAWRADVDSEFITNVIDTIEAINGTWVLLEQVVSEDVVYAEEKVATECLNEIGYLSAESAALIKQNSYTHSNAEAVMQGIDAVIFTGGEDISPPLSTPTKPTGTALRTNGITIPRATSATTY